jgi:hypothetical protein
MKSSENRRLYLVCVHYGLSRGKDWKLQAGRLLINYDTLTPKLAKDLCYLRTVLAPKMGSDGQIWEGFAFVFLDPGWTDLCREAAGSPLKMATLVEHLTRAQIKIEESLDEDNILKSCHSKREQIVTAAHLINLLKLLDAAERSKKQSFFEIFIGKAETMRYDSPKVIEAAIRIANIGRHVPVFRFDDDVIFCGQRSPEFAKSEKKRLAEAKRTADSILLLCDRYRQLSMDPQVHYFLYSGGYNLPSKIDENVESIDPSAFGNTTNDPFLVNGFATRILYLAQLPKTRNINSEDNDEGSIRSKDVLTFLKDLYKLGANPFRQVISGGGLCLSDSAILDLPPYSNMQLNVMWIDDHLKYAIHDELGHFGRRTRTHYPARVPGALFSQLRHARKHRGAPLFTYHDVRWHVKMYMLRLILGCIADSWLRTKADLKLSTRELDNDRYEELGQWVPGIYANQFMDMMPGGWSDDSATIKSDFSNKLWQKGIERMNEMITAWGDHVYKNTFLGLFVHGDAHQRYKDFVDYFPAGMPRGFQKAVQELPAQYPSTHKSRLSGIPDEPSLQVALEVLVNDFTEYFSLVQFWPSFVQSVRSLLNQHAQFYLPDLEWMVPRFYPEKKLEGVS